MMGNLIWGGVGFFLGWMVFQRPKFATDFFDWVKAKMAGDTPAK